MEKKNIYIIIAIILAIAVVFYFESNNLFMIYNTQYFEYQYTDFQMVREDTDKIIFSLTPLDINNIIPRAYSDTWFVEYELTNNYPRLNMNQIGIRCNLADSLQFGKSFKGTISGSYDIVLDQMTIYEHTESHPQEFNVECTTTKGPYDFIGHIEGHCTPLYPVDDGVHYLSCDNGGYGVWYVYLSCRVYGDAKPCTAITANGCKLKVNPGTINVPIYKTGYNPPTCKTSADTDCNNAVDRTELGVHINKWISGTVTRTDLGQAIAAWSGG